MKSLIKRLEGLTIVKFTLLIASIMSVVSCKSNKVSILGLEDKNSNEVHPLNMDFAESIDRSEKKVLADVKDIPTMDYKIVKGDSLWKIAEKFDTEVSALKRVNYLRSDLLNLNQELLIPLSNSQNQTFIPYQAHIISEGDTLWSLGRKYDLVPRDIAKSNGLKIDSPLRIGKELNIGNKNIYRTINSKKRTILYSVKQGDSLYRIADIFNIEITDIKKINELSNNEINPGQVLKIIIKAF